MAKPKDAEVPAPKGRSGPGKPAPKGRAGRSGPGKAAPKGRKGRSNAAATESKRVTPKGTGRYTPPVPRSQKVSPIWVPILMFTCLLGGMAMIILNYVDVLPGGVSNGYLLGGLVLITVGFITATRYH